ncbi:MAG TPA: hypothetical protein VMV81_14420 [Phycisphaerae bacterium]|nr:hypothetical protein [Phycisphaerae bacterium]
MSIQRNKSVRRARSTRAKRPGGGLEAFFPKLAGTKKRFGVGVLLALAQRQGDEAAVRYAAIEEAFERPGLRPKAALLARADARKISELLTGLAHPDRIRVATAIMTGANTHRLLKESLQLKTGPLYHHLRELQMAGLVGMASRNFYVLTEPGELALYIATGLAAGLGKAGRWKRRRLSA